MNGLGRVDTACLGIRTHVFFFLVPFVRARYLCVPSRCRTGRGWVNIFREESGVFGFSVFYWVLSLTLGGARCLNIRLWL